MPPRLSPEVTAAHDCADAIESVGGEHVNRCVVIYTTESGKIGLVTYGRTITQCAQAKTIGRAAMRAAKHAAMGCS